VTTDTKETTCLSDGEKVSITYMCYDVEKRPRDPVILRIESWTCDKSQSCQDMNCLGKNRNGRIKGWNQ